MAITLSARLEAVMQLAGAEAARRNHRLFTLEHVLWAMVNEGEARALVAACGADVEELARELVEYLELMDAPARGKRPEPDEAVQRVLTRAATRALSAKQAELDVGDVLADLMGARDAYAAMLIYAAGVTRVDALRVIAHGTRDVRATAPSPSGAQLVVLLHNDHFTTMELVVRVLREVFELDEARATELMLRVHREGAAVAAVLPAAEAIARAERVHEMAEEAEAPLRVSLVVG